jgi:hemerythrin superfamily protein
LHRTFTDTTGHEVARPLRANPANTAKSLTALAGWGSAESDARIMHAPTPAVRRFGEDSWHYAHTTHRETNMAKAKTRSVKARPAKNDAVALLKADHRQVADWFEEFAKARAATRKQTLAASICAALRVHTQIEEEIFYPAFLEATKDEDLHHEAVVEHDGAKQLIAQIEASSPADDYYDAKVKVLSEMIKHHVKEEEQPGGMFAEARASKLDLEELGAQMLSRKQQLEGKTGKKAA